MTATTFRVLRAADVTGLQQEAATRASREQAQHDERAEELRAARAEGVVAGLAMARQEGADAVPRLAAALEELARTSRAQHERCVDETSRAILANAIDLAEWVLRHELSSSSTSLLDRLAHAATMLLPGPSVRVSVHPDDLHLVAPWAAQQGAALEGDATLERGDARFDNGNGTVDVSVGAALRVAAQALGVDPAQGPR